MTPEDDTFWSAIRCSFNDLTMMSSILAAGTRETDPTAAVLEFPSICGEEI
jgi:hypothetical protein